MLISFMLIEGQSYPVLLITDVRHELGGVTTDLTDDKRLARLYQDLLDDKFEIFR